jgi:fructose/tagatose bisphosphate aldolase
MTSAAILRRARELGVALPAFNIPFPPMMEPVVRAVVDEDSFALVEVARIEWLTFEIEGLERFMREYRACADPRHVRSHLDHIPVVDEEGVRVDYRPIIEEAITRGFDSVMIDGSHLPLDENIAATREVAALARASGIPCEAELGAILRFGVGEVPPYAELFASGRGFTKVSEAVRFVAETGCDWLSVSIGNIHGAVSAALRGQPKGESRLNLDHLEALSKATGVPLVLHGGSGVRREDVLASMKRGIVKVNVGHEIRKAYEDAVSAAGGTSAEATKAGQDAVYKRTRSLLKDYFGIAGIARSIRA